MNENTLFIITFSIVLSCFLFIELLIKKRKGEKVSVLFFALRFASIVMFVYMVKLTFL